jgi:uncharacterized protein DUF4258
MAKLALRRGGRFRDPVVSSSCFSKAETLSPACASSNGPRGTNDPNGNVRAVIETGEVIEDYPDDPGGHSCLMLGLGQGGRPVHVVCAPKTDYLAIITAYLPDTAEWSSEFKTRKTK